ncbi:MAG: late competence development ComFB family protein [Pseudanabaenaceae cyanobacterium bins.68]|nr:late competence development ComFB family protein [Pseudanabaenaceae cyanobacterium bins.68]
MANFRNALEPAVVNAAKKQLEELQAEGKLPPIAEVVAYTLNRLPPKYATTHRGWIRHRDEVLKSMQLEIYDTINRGIQVLRLGDPLHDSQPIPDQEFQCKSMALVKLRQILEQPLLEWQDVPGAVSRRLGQLEGRVYELPNLPEPQVSQGRSVKAQDSRYSGVSPANRQIIANLVDYSQRRRAKNWQKTNEAIANSDLRRPKTQTRKIFDLDLDNPQDVLQIYTLKANLGFSNVLENLVLSAAQAVAKQVDADVRSQINLAEVSAYALNRLPPMYATSQRGWEVLRRKAKEELAREILLRVKAAFEQVLNRPKRNPQPLPFQKIELEYDDALLQLQIILHREDLNWLNLTDIVEQELNSAYRRSIGQ